MEIWIPRKLTVMGLMPIILLPTSHLSESTQLVENHLIYLMVTMKYNMKGDSENSWNHHDDDGTIDDDAEENGLGDDEDFERFD